MTSSIKWPGDGKPLSYEDVSGSIKKAIRFAYDLKRKNLGRSVPWSGPPIAHDEAANSLGAGERLSAASLRYSEEEQGRDALDEIIGVALQVGIEQGRRIYKNSDALNTLRLRLRTYRLGLERLASLEALVTARVVDPQTDKELLARVDYARKFTALSQLDGDGD